MKRNLSIVGLLLPLLFLGAGCLGLGGAPAVVIKPITLEYWRIDDEPESMADIIEAYRKIHPNVTVTYKKFRTEDYQRMLLEAFAEDRGPDIFSVPNVWLKEWKSKIQPMPKETIIPTQTVNASKQIVTVNKKTPTLTIREMLNGYIEVATKDVIMKGDAEPGKKAEDQIYGLPLSADTLGLYYNEDLLKKADISKPPETWRQVQDQAGAMTILEGEPPNQTIKQSGAAIGTANNLAHYTELLSVLMMQYGAEMSDDYGFATFANFPQGKPVETPNPPGVEALQFYVSFAIKGAPFFSWDDSMPNSLDAFVAGKTAFYFGYPNETAIIRARAPGLKFSIAKLPQMQPPTPQNIARYPVEVVSKKTKNPNEAWDFIQFLASPAQVPSFLNATKRPTALRGLIAQQLTDPDIAPFTSQLLTARSWYKGNDYKAVEDAFKKMINTKPTFQRPEWIPIVAQAAGEVNATSFR